MNKQVITIDGVKYNSLEEIPEKYKKFINKELIEKLKKDPKNYRSVEIKPVSPGSIEFKASKWILIIASQMMSLAEIQAMRIVAISFNIVDVNIYLSLIFGLLTGQISYSLAQRYYSKKTEKLNVKYSESLGFLKKIEIAQLSAGYSFVLNLLFFFILFLVKQI